MDTRKSSCKKYFTAAFCAEKTEFTAGKDVHKAQD